MDCYKPSINFGSLDNTSYDDISFMNNDIESNINTIYRNEYISDYDEFEYNNILIQFGDFYVPDFGMSFKENDDIDLKNIDRKELGNCISINKMLGIHPDININIYNDEEKNMIYEIRKLLNKYYLSEQDYIDEVSKMLINKNSMLYKFLVYNENYLIKYFNLKYENSFNKNDDVNKKLMQFKIRHLTYNNSTEFLHPVNIKYYNFRTKEKELFKIFLKKKREIYFTTVVKFFEWFNKCNELLLLSDWNCAWIVQNMIKIKIFENFGKTDKEIDVLAGNLEKLNNKIGRNNDNY